MDNQLKDKKLLNLKQLIYLTILNMKKLSTIFLLVLFISQMNGQKIDSLTIDKTVLPTALLTGGIFY
jgi:hypothetical protein